MKSSFWNKAASLLCCAGLLAAMLAGCAADDPVTGAMVETLTVQVESVQGNSVTAVVGALQQQTAAPGDSMGEPPSGDMSATPDGSMGEPPSGDMGGGTPPDGMGGGQALEFVASPDVGAITFTITDSTAITVEFLQGSQEGAINDIVVDAVLEVSLDAYDNATDIVVKNLSAGGGFGGSDTVTNGTTVTTITEDGTYSGDTYTSTGDDENALRVDGATVTLEDIVVEKTAGDSSNTENGDFYGQNAALLVLNGSTTTITGTTVNTSAVNGNGVFSYGAGTTVNISDSVIRTTERNSGGIQTTGGATTNATNLDVETLGASAAAIRSDRGGGTVNVDGGRYITGGTGSPAVYCTADITVSNATLTASASEAVVVEGQNSVSLVSCTTQGDMQGTYGESSENIQAIMIYQSMSGDAAVGHASFSAEGGSILARNGDLFYVTNTSCTISLKGVALTLANDILLHVAGNDASRGWGTAGANGGQVTFTAQEQFMSGSILVDDISTLQLSMESNTTFTGSINPTGQAGEVNVALDATSTWTLTGDSYISTFDGDMANVVTNGYTLYVGGAAMN